MGGAEGSREVGRDRRSWPDRRTPSQILVERFVEGAAGPAERVDRTRGCRRPASGPVLRQASPARPATAMGGGGRAGRHPRSQRSEEHTSELQSLMRISYAVFCLKKKTT